MTTCKFQIKLGNEDYLQMYKTIQLIASLHLIQATWQALKLLKTHKYRHKVIENAKLIKASIELKCSFYTDIF
jgi:hypothetical protein